jgi:branched-chain amino acid transport system permease protein
MAFDILGFVISFASVYGIFALLALSLNLEYGYAGQPNFGQVLFFGIGSFTSGIVTATLLPILAGVAAGNICSTESILTRETISSSQPGLAISVWFLSILISACVASIFGFLASYPAIRVKEEWFLSMILLVGAEIFRIVVRNTPQLGCGYNGLPGISNPFSWMSSNSNSQFAVYLSSGLYAVSILLFLGIAYLLAQRWANSPYARLLKSIRDDRLLASTFGKDVNRTRAQIMVIGSAIAGIAGALYVYYIGVAISEDYISAVTFSVWVMIVLGGIGNNRGAIVGAAALVSIQKGMQILGVMLQQNYPLLDPNMTVYANYMIQSLMLLILIIFKPRGLIPEEPVKTVAYDVVGKVE